MKYTESILYGIQSKRALKSLLKISDDSYFDQQFIAGLIRPYIEHKKKDRLIEVPSIKLRVIQTRIKKFFYSIPVNTNVFSGIKGRSYPDNAKIHVGDKYVYKVDLKAFFPSISREKVYSFFKNSFDLSPDVAEILTNLTTVNLDFAQDKNKDDVDKFLNSKGIKTRNHLISGAPTSQVLSYLVNYTMFNEIQAYCDANGVTFSIYVDDLTFSSDKKILYRFKETIQDIINNHFYRLSKGKSKGYAKGYRKEITGAIIASNGSLILTNSLRYKIINEFKYYSKHTYDDTSKKRLLGLLIAARQVVPNAFPSIYKFVKGRMKMTIIEKCYDWLGNRNEAHSEDVKKRLDIEQIRIFLLLYPIFESDFVETHKHKDKLSGKRKWKYFLEKELPNIKIVFKELEPAIKYFHARYNRNPSKYIELIGDRQGERFFREVADRVVKHSYKETSKEEDKIHFLIYVIYRWRNNLFHGLKKINDFDDYKEGFEYCLSSLIIIMDSLKDESY